MRGCAKNLTISASFHTKLRRRTWSCKNTRPSMQNSAGIHMLYVKLCKYSTFCTKPYRHAQPSVWNRAGMHNLLCRIVQNVHYITYEIVQEFDFLYRARRSSSYYRIEFRKRYRKPTSQGNKSPNNKPLGDIPGNRPLSNASLGSASPGNTPLGTVSPSNTPLGTASPSDTPPSNKLPSNKAAR